MPTQPFSIQVPESSLQRLQQKLALTDFPLDDPVLSSSSWSPGPPVGEIKRLVNVWQKSYDWRSAEAHLNTFPQFVTALQIGGLGTFDVHHVHAKSTQSNAIPLLFLHGWPGSFIEVTKIVQDLVGGVSGSPSFHVVAPSLINFGFSSAGGTEFTVEHHAEAYDKLMQELGYEAYVIQAGDVGSLVTRFIVKKFGVGRCKAYHTNTPFAAEPSEKLHPELYAKCLITPLSEAEKAGLGRRANFFAEGYGYVKQQSTKPRTLGYSLKDSPVGLLAWLYEKMHDWSDGYPWTDDEILTWVSIYYFSRAGPDASINVYYAIEHAKPSSFIEAQEYVDVPVGIAWFANDSVVTPKLWAGTLGPVLLLNEHDRGGHFAAWERPDAIVGDVRSLFSKIQVVSQT
ncbi:hypothetical protein G7046_g5978 [Stylonectria norvegica]|nr:hypothetical protein G7046_g5978 [Stylonectria norvegica]